MMIHKLFADHYRATLRASITVVLFSQTLSHEKCADTQLLTAVMMKTEGNSGICLKPVNRD